MTNEPIPGWDGWDNEHRREDGTRVAHGNDGWVIMLWEGREVITTCFCCGLPFANARAAKLVADKVYPPRPRDA